MIAPVRFGLMLAPPSERPKDPIQFFKIPTPLERQLQELAGIHGRRQVLAERAYFRSPERCAELTDGELKELRGLNTRFSRVLSQLAERFTVDDVVIQLRKLMDNQRGRYLLGKAEAFKTLTSKPLEQLERLWKRKGLLLDGRERQLEQTILALETPPLFEKAPAARLPMSRETQALVHKFAELNTQIDQQIELRQIELFRTVGARRYPKKVLLGSGANADLLKPNTFLAMLGEFYEDALLRLQARERPSQKKMPLEKVIRRMSGILHSERMLLSKHLVETRRKVSRKARQRMRLMQSGAVFRVERAMKSLQAHVDKVKAKPTPS